MDSVTGDAPQPGETPRSEGNPWTFDPDAAFWRGEGDRELAEAATRARKPRRRPLPDAPGSTPPAPGSTPPAPGSTPPAPGSTPPAPGEDFAEEAHATGVRDTEEALAEPEDEADADPADTAEWVDVDRYDTAEVPGRPDPGRNQPTVALDRGAVPDQPSGLPRPDRRGQSRMSAAELNLKRSRMENSPFWLDEEERATAGDTWPEPEKHRPPDTTDPLDELRGIPPLRRPRTPRAAAPGLFGLIALGLIAAFFSWVSAEPFWLAAGHGERGVATITRCVGTGVTQRCAGSFTAADGVFSAGTVSLLGVPRGGSEPGAVAPARMVKPTSSQAYVGSSGTLLQLRWVLGFLLVLLCGLGIAGLTGTRRLESIRARRAGLLLSFAGPLVLLFGFLFATY